MKKSMILFCLLALTSFFFLSCKKKIADPITEEQAVANLTDSKDFQDFSKKFIPDLLLLANYHRQLKDRGGRVSFINELKLTNGEEANIAAVYEKFSLSYEDAMLLKNRVDNDLLRLFHQNPFLLQFDEAGIKRILINSLQEGLHSADLSWIRTKEEINQAISQTTVSSLPQSNRQTNGVRVNKIGITIDEIWECLKDAAGFGSGGILGIAGLSRLAKDGIQEAVIGASKWLAKRAGWIGAAIALVDFSSCLYHESID